MAKGGPYEFTDQDVERTLAEGRSLFDLLPGGFPPDAEGIAAPYRARAEDALDNLAEADPEGALGVLWASWHAAVDALRADGAFGPPAGGTATGLFVGEGGAPKHAQGSLDITWSGPVGDRQGDRKNHGRPWQALCLWSTEVIDNFVADGHPLAPGLAGENIALTGLPWDRVVPGALLRVGDVALEISSYAVPCRKNAGWFTDGRFDMMHHKHGPVSRVYATVLEPGPVRLGDPVLLEPAS